MSVARNPSIVSTIQAVTFLAGAAAGGFIARFLHRRGRATPTGALGAHLLPDPALDWLRRAHGAIGVWVSEAGDSDDGPRAERILDAEGLSTTAIAAVDRRLELAREQTQNGVERMEGGTLVFRSAPNVAVGILLRQSGPAAALVAVGDDLDRLIEGVRRRPVIVPLIQAQAQSATLESLGSVGLRLAFQLERVIGLEALVVAITSAGVRVIGVSGRGDRRVLDSYVAPDSYLARVAVGELDRSVIETDPLGGVVADRRVRSTPMLLVPMAVAGEPVGAAAVALHTAAEPTGAILAEIVEAVNNAAPRVARAAQSERLKQAATVDPLTGLCNRRGLDSEMQRFGITRGTLIYADLDKFKSLNDTLGHPAGDAALVYFARLLRGEVRTSDTASRIGGEEFAIWLPGAPLEIGERIAERARAKLSGTPWEWQGQPWRLSASFGVAACPETSRSLDNLPTQADAALYAAKRGGRNRVEIAG